MRDFRYLPILVLCIIPITNCRQPPVPTKYKSCSNGSNAQGCSSKEAAVKEQPVDSKRGEAPGAPKREDTANNPQQPETVTPPDVTTPTPDKPIEKPETPNKPEKPKDPVMPPENDVDTGQCINPEKWSFSNYPASWDIEGTGRIKDAMVNETIVKDAEKGSVLEVKYGKGTTSPSASRLRGLTPGGTQFIAKMKKSYGHSVMSYWLKIPKDFDCAKGGKLPGLASNAELLSGGETADGTNGFSVRLMWRKDCEAEVYAYLPRVENQHLIDKYKDSLTQNQTTKIIYGWSIGRGEFSLPKGNWIKVDLTVKVNDPGVKNGVVKVALNGKQVFQRDEIVYRTNSKLQTGALFFSTFFGGSDESYGATKDESLFFGDLSICSL